MSTDEGSERTRDIMSFCFLNWADTLDLVKKIEKQKEDKGGR